MSTECSNQTGGGNFGLSLSLGFLPAADGLNGGSHPTRSFPLNLLMNPPLSFMNHTTPKDDLPSSPSATSSDVEDKNEGGGMAAAAAGGIDINQPAEYEDDNLMGSSSPHSTGASTVTGKRSEREFDAEEEAVAAEMTGSSVDEDGGDAAAAARKKLRLTKEQAAVLEDTFKGHCTLNPKQKVALAKQLNLKPRQVEVWFQNRRARTKLKQTEVDCEYLRRCCERLAEENRRLLKEVGDLRALKLSPQLYMNVASPPPAAAAVMCSHCQHITAAPLPSPPSAAAPLIQWAAILQPQHHHHHSQRPQQLL
ncbi:hypothetical protein DM860_004479 [Cuscuta australis]|uniref:Homeobox domain-containing protein n=1 Tax=Cuscuta australis TaxID=267555 RepID=A0A328EBD7_9ASTE|nr:hypothetical protein DM860_004479 [Cuscuta australis]